MSGIVDPCFFSLISVINMTKSALHQSYNQIITEQQLARDR